MTNKIKSKFIIKLSAALAGVLIVAFTQVSIDVKIGEITIPNVMTLRQINLSIDRTNVNR